MNDTAIATRPKDKVGIIEAELTRLAPKILAQLPNGMSADRFQVVTLQAVAKNPDLMECEPASIVLAVLEAASVGLEPTGVLGQAWLVPYKPKDASRAKAQLQIGYNGYRTLARRSGEVSSIEARVVYEADHFEVHYGTDQRIVHDPAFENDPAKITHAYAVTKMRDGTILFDVMTRKEIDGIRARSRSGNRGPWVTDTAEMSRKTVIRRHVKALPMTVEAARLIEADDEIEFGSHVTPTVTVSRTAQVRDQLAARNGPGAPEAVEVAAGATPPVGEAPDPAPAPLTEICGANPPSDALGMTMPCTQAPHTKGAHSSDEGSWPIVVS